MTGGEKMKMNRRFRLILIIFSVMFITISLEFAWDLRQVQRVTAPYEEIENKTQYTMTLEFVEETMTLQVREKIVYMNQQEKALSNIYFHLYPNAFRTKSEVPFEKKEMTKAYPNGFNSGYIEILDIKQGKKPVDYKLMGDSSTVLRITPSKPVEVGSRIEFFIDFFVKLPNTYGRMGYGDNTVNIANWFPIVAVYDERGWNLDPYYAIGDPFYSEVASYKVTAILPKEYKMATTGNVIKTNNKKQNNIYEIEAKQVRNFVMILSKKFDVKETMLDDTKVLSYSIGGLKGKETLQYGVDALKIFNSLFGTYPYEQLSIVACDFFVGGMEYPNVVMINQELYEREEDFPLEYVVAHEIAHQWWYGIVGNNEVREPWLDEALTEYTTLMYFEKKYGPHIKEQIFDKMIKGQYENYIDLESDKGEGILRSLKEFDNSWQYSSIVYNKGAMFVHELREEMGEESFLNTLREYFEAYKYKNATTEDFLAICQKNTKKDLTPLFSQWLNGNL